MKNLAWLAAAAFATPALAAETVWGVTADQRLVTWDAAAPGTFISGVGITNLEAGETVRGIDFRPATNELYALGSMDRLYKINTLTGVASQVPPNFPAPLSGTSFGFDFNPTVDRIRVVSDTDANSRLHPDTASVTTDLTINYVPGDSNFGANPTITGAGYTNSFFGAVTTTLYVLDTGLDVLAIQSPANNGTLTTVGSFLANFSDIGGFEISGETGFAYAANADGSGSSGFWRINLSSGKANFIGTLGGGGTVISAISMIPGPGALGALGLAALAAARRRR